MHATSRVGGAFRLASLLDPSLPSGKPRAPRHLKPCSTDTWRPRAHAEVGPWRSPSAPAERARIDSSGGDRTPTATASGRERQVEAPWPRVPGDISCSDPTGSPHVAPEHGSPRRARASHAAFLRPIIDASFRPAALGKRLQPFAQVPECYTTSGGARWRASIWLQACESPKRSRAGTEAQKHPRRGVTLRRGLTLSERCAPQTSTR